MDENQESIKSEWREVPAGQLYLERLEAAGMRVMTQAVLDKEMDLAWNVASLLRYLSIV